MDTGNVAGYRDDHKNRTPSSRYVVDAPQRSVLAYVVACESWNQYVARPTSQERGVR